MIFTLETATTTVGEFFREEPRSVADEAARRRIATILAADGLGYSRLMDLDEWDTFERLRAHRKDFF